MTSYRLTQVAKHEALQQRVQYMMVKAAVAKLNAASPPAADLLLGKRILDNQESLLLWTLAVCTNPTIAAGDHAEDGSTILDGDLEFAVNSLWSAFAV